MVLVCGRRWRRRKGRWGQWLVGWLVGCWVVGGGVMNDIVDLGHMMVAAITSGGSIDEWKPSRLCFGGGTGIPRRLRW